MRHKLKYPLIALTVTALAFGMMLAGFGGAVFAAPSDDVTITATPTFICIVLDVDTWTLNGITGDSKIEIDTVYYSNPMGDTSSPGETVNSSVCRFEVDNTSNVAVDLTVNIGDFSGGDAMQNSDSDGSNGAGEFGAFSWCDGMTYAEKVVAKTTGSAVMKENLAVDTDLKWGAEIETQTDAWTSADAMTSTMTITATEHS